ncbi:MAG: putrescine ABC transporter periplasmic binding protein [Arenicellales bacterium IbO2]|nr:extracellular solute-binding protein [Gammaproteobacteria bacterium]CAJ2377323.1 MAG: putrescine ABC transporter periplasmic binding protein [Arenicellales bacterium IbO2]
MKFSRIAVALLLAVFTVAAHAQGKTLHVTNWAEYIAEDTIANFEKEFGIKVVYDNYDSIESIDAKLLAGNSGYDVVSHSGSQIGRLIPAGGILQKIDKSKLPNLKHMREDIMKQLATNWDPGNQYVVPYMWGTHGVTYNEQAVRSVHPDAPIGSLEMVFDPKHMEKLAQCGVAFLDSPEDVIPMALAHLGLDPSSRKKADYKKAEEMLLKVRPYIKTFDNYAYQRMPEREFCVAVTWGPDGLLAMSQAAEANTGVVLDFFSPPGPGAANIWVDGWVIPADAKNVEGAHLFMNYMMRPEVAANDSNFTWYATGNATAHDMVDENVTSSIAAYPPARLVREMYTLAVVPQKVERVRTRTWTKFKSGN